jgi:4-alpha-glucanotransferase
LHVSSLPSEYGIGDLGPEAYRWIDFLARARQGFWQVLPLNPTTPSGHNSPYQAASVFAGNPLLISPTALLDDGFLREEDLSGLPAFPADRVDYHEAAAARERLLDAAYGHFTAARRPTAGYGDFCEKNSSWLDDYALFMALRRRFPERPWPEWPKAARDREYETLAKLRGELSETMERERFLQYLFFKQWSRLKGYANERGVQILGDLPFYVGYDSADVWCTPGLFKLDDSKQKKYVAGVPPDYFSGTGQLWGNPVYEWPEHARTGYAWWIERIRHNLGLFDIVRIDHFRGFAAHWEVPAGLDTAVHGSWATGPGAHFFDRLLRFVPFARIIAEDLGTITADVRELMHAYDLPGMKVLLFAFDGESASNPYLPHNHVPNSVLYTGTHDNNTVRGWFENEANPEQKVRLGDYLGFLPSGTDVHWSMIRLAMMSVSELAVIPMQDVLGLGEGARMNRPSVAAGNWEWRMQPGQAAPDLAEKLARLAAIYGRA